MKFKAVFIDMDQTLLNNEHKISENNKIALAKASELGVKIILCSGRSYIAMLDFLKELDFKEKPNYISSFNGGIILSTDGEEITIIKQEGLELPLALDLLKELRKFDADIIIYNDPSNTIIEKKTKYIDWYYEVTKMNHKIVNNLEDFISSTPSKLLILGDRPKLDNINKIISEKMGSSINMFFSATEMLEFTSKNISKGNSLLYLSNILNFKPSETIAIGDNHNDISMIMEAGLGVAVSNASDEVKAYADYVTNATNHESAVAEVINKFILKS